MDIFYSSRFKKSFKEIPTKIQTLAILKTKQFQNNPNTRSLHNHPLKRKLKGYFSFRINYAYRILYRFDENGDALFADIGTHSIYQ